MLKFQLFRLIYGQEDDKFDDLTLSYDARSIIITPYLLVLFIIMIFFTLDEDISIPFFLKPVGI